jgi:hypothetical protein
VATSILSLPFDQPHPASEMLCAMAMLPASLRIALDNPLSSSLLGDEKRVSSLVLRSAAGDPGYPVAAVGLRMAACLWQALPKKFTRTEFIASVLAGAGRKEAPRRDERDPFSP